MIRATSLSKSFGRLQAVRDVSFEVTTGSVVGFLGPNGAGKSTTMRMLTGFLSPDAGRVEIGEFGMAEQPLEARSQVGYLPENTPLYGGMRVDDYLEHVAKLRGIARPERARALGRAAERAGLHGMLTRRVRTLSKGYRQRVGLAQALISDPPVLILDEPTSGLDPAEVGRMRSLVRELGTDKTVLLSSHVLGEIEELCARVLILSGGQLVADDSLDALRCGQDSTLILEVRGQLEEVRALLAAQPVLASFDLGPGEREGLLEADLFADSGRVIDDVAVAIAAAVVGAGFGLVRLERRRRTLHEVFLDATRGAAEKASA